MQSQHPPTLWGQFSVNGRTAPLPSHFSAFDTLTASLEQVQQRPLRRDLGVLAMVLMSMSVALARFA
jgi:hypothetical protein